MVLLADRFLAARGAWTDVATGLRVNLRVIKPCEVEGPTLKGGDQFGWADRCASLSLLRHPLINPLLDYGSCDASHLFEAYAANTPVCASGVPAARLLAHAAEFLETRGVPVAPGQASLLLREVTAGPSPAGRPVGLVLQKRAALDAVIDALDAQTPAGTVHLAVTGPPGSGLTTLQTLVAREARLRGYVAVCVNVLARFPSVVELLPGRHVCLIAEEPLPDQGQRLLAAVVARLGVASARRHVVVRFHRATSWVSSTVLLDRLGAAAMTGMVFVDREMGPSAGELFEAARASDGRPGAFLRALRAVAFPPHESRHGVLHETAPRYETADPGETSEGADVMDRPSVRGEALSNAGPRAEALAKAGRHAAACRLLVRAGRVQERRNNPAAAAQCAYTLAWILRARGRSNRAVESFDRCATLAGKTPLAISAVVGRGVVQTDEGRLVEAEATLRSATVAAQSIGDDVTHRAAALALARALLWQGRHDESSSVLAAMVPAACDEPLAVEVWALTARVRLAQGDVRAALDAARRAVDVAERLQDGRRSATAHRAMAAVLANLGDETAAREHVGRGLTGARAAHLPLAAVRLRLVLGARGTAGHYGVSTVQPASAAAASGVRAMLPRLLDAQVKAAAGIDVADVVRDTGARALLTSGEHRGPFAHVEALLEMSHAAPDDRSALERICAHVCSELRACTVAVVTSAEGREVVASAGKPWHGDMKAGAQALGSGRGVQPDPLRQPQQAAEPVRFGGRVVAALACRWTAGTSVNAGVAEELLRAGALAAAASVRAVLDARPAPGDQQPAARDLLGESAAAIALRDAIARAARAPFPVLVEGESGSGKELVARAIHRLGPRRDRRWCAVNCAAITDDLLEAELFGHARGAFTGAACERAGLFEEADGGTLFLDEVGDLSLRAQAKLLRVLQDGEVRRVGENLPRRVDVRVVAATNRRLEDDAAAGRFRGDLRFRLDVVRIVVPPLRERIADIPLLAGHFWRTASAQVGSSAALAPETLAALARYDWPGNVRELQNVIAWMAVHSPRRGRVGPSSLPAQLAQATAPSAGTFEVAREEFERRFVRAALARAGGHRSRAADALGISRQGLAKMLRRLNIDTP